MTIQNNDDNLFVSPFLNFDPSALVFNPSEQFIYSEGEKYRGRFERSFSEIGGMVLGGASLGAARGLYNGLIDNEIKKLPSTSVQRTQILNHITKSGATLSQTAGSIGLIYALADYFVYKCRGNADDEINTVCAATFTGCMYRSTGLFKPGGWQRCLRGGAIGLGFGLTAISFTSWSSIKKMLGG